MKSFCLAGILIGGAALAQQAGPSFEVATVKPAAPNQRGSSLNYTRDTMKLDNVSLRQAILFIYELRDYQVTGGAKWVNSEAFDIVGKAEAATVKPNELRAMAKALLADRFQLMLRKETRPLPAYALVAAKRGTKLQPAGKDDVTSSSSGPALLKAHAMTMSGFAELIAAKLHRFVVDRTGAPGAYNFDLHFAADNAPPDSGEPSFSTALEEQYGLKLQATTAPGDVYVIERAERPGAN